MLKKLKLLSLIVCMLASLLAVVPLTARAADTIVSYPLPSIYTTTSQYTVTADSTNITINRHFGGICKL